jgi:hypothetical protein
VPVGHRAEVARAEPGRPVGHAPQRLGQPARRDGGDHRAGADRQHHEQQHHERHLNLFGAHQPQRLLHDEHVTRRERQRLCDRVVPDVRADHLVRLASALQHQPPARRHRELDGRAVERAR